MGLRIVREPCKCCQTSQPCCEYGIHAPVQFTPHAGWDMVSADVSNSNQYKCVGRAKADIVLSKPANPGPACVNWSDCSWGMNGKNFRGKTTSQSLALWAAWLNESPGAWNYHSQPDLHDPIAEPYWNCNYVRLQWSSPNNSAYCGPGFDNNGMWKKTIDTFIPETEYTTWLATQKAEANAALAGVFIGKKIAWTARNQTDTSDCHYELTGTNWYDRNVWACRGTYQYGPPAGWHIHFVALSAAQMHFSMKCTCEPCTMGDYDWPTVLGCACAGEYERPGVNQTPSCELILDHTSREYSGGKCLFKATYVGALEGGLVNCTETPDAADCKCCGEGGP